MKTRYHENGWVIFIDEDVRTLSDDEIKEVVRLTVSNMVVVFKKQTLTTEDQIRICSVMGKVQRTESERSKHISLTDGILRVTGQKDQYGKEGLFGHKHALDWHANQPSNKERKPLIWLYGAEGTVGSRTSWINNIISYEDLSDEMKERLKGIRVICGYRKGSYSDSEYFNEHLNRDNPIDLVQTNQEGKVGLFFPFLQIFEFEGKTQDEFDELMSILRNHVLQEK